ncbi:MAG: class I SAM-dependent methyltransferase, partial [Pyrinomonadaceae bacterium]
MKGNQYISALNYDWLSPYYDMVVAATSREREFKTALVEQAEIRSRHRILDLACGAGTLAILIKNSQPSASVTGIDGDPKILAIARKKSLDAGAEIQFDEGLSYDMPYQNEIFDRVTSSLFFHHLTRENKLKTLSEAYRVLKPGGEFHIAD